MAAQFYLLYKYYSNAYFMSGIEFSSSSNSAKTLSRSSGLLLDARSWMRAMLIRSETHVRANWETCEK